MDIKEKAIKMAEETFEKGPKWAALGREVLREDVAFAGVLFALKGDQADEDAKVELLLAVIGYYEERFRKLEQNINNLAGLVLEDIENGKS